MARQDSFSSSKYLGAPSSRVSSRNVSPSASPTFQPNSSYFPYQSGVRSPLLSPSSIAPSRNGAIHLPLAIPGAPRSLEERWEIVQQWFRDNQGLVLIAGSQALFASMNASVKVLQGEEQGGGLPTLQLVAIRMVSRAFQESGYCMTEQGGKVGNYLYGMYFISILQ